MKGYERPKRNCQQGKWKDCQKGTVRWDKGNILMRDGEAKVRMDKNELMRRYGKGLGRMEQEIDSG